jgi:hypothetical protein
MSASSEAQAADVIEKYGLATSNYRRFKIKNRNIRK